MLSTIGNVFFEVTTMLRSKGEYVPTIFLNIRNSKTGKMMGQMRFNQDVKYSKEHIRMAFNIMNSDLINPEKGGSELLEEIVVGGLIWMSMDNNYLVPQGVLPYMVVHDYAEDNGKTSMINADIRSILAKYGCVEQMADMFVFNPYQGNSMLSEFLKEKQQC